jgi:hypothetical protein
MAISDMKGTVTTTGMMNQPTKMPKGKVDPKIPQPVAAKPNTQPAPQPTPEQKLEQELTSKFPGLKNLTAEDNAALDAILSPSVKQALGKVVPELEPIFSQFGTNEPNVVLPVSIVSNYAKRRYGGNDDEALAAFMEDVSGQMETQQTTNVPPSQPTETAGLMTSPQNMETV